MERIGKIIFKITAIILSTLPEAITTVLIRLSAISLFAFSPGKRRNVRRNLSIAGMRREEITNRHIMKIFENQTRNTFELFASTRWSDEKIAQRFTIEGKEIMDEAVALGRGTILVSPHVGNWELAAMRAVRVVRLLRKVGVPGKNISAAAFAEFQPTSTNRTRMGRRLNRRIEITLLPVIPRRAH